MYLWIFAETDISNISNMYVFFEGSYRKRRPFCLIYKDCVYQDFQHRNFFVPFRFYHPLGAAGYESSKKRKNFDDDAMLGSSAPLSSLWLVAFAWKRRKLFRFSLFPDKTLATFLLKFELKRHTVLTKKVMYKHRHSVWKSPKKSHLNIFILAFSTKFWPIKTELSGNTVWPQALGFQKLN